MLTYLEQAAELNADDVHIIAHSLGSHVSFKKSKKMVEENE